MTNIYMYEEPERSTREVYVDQKGGVHLTREDAITVNVEEDARAMLLKELVPAITDDHELRSFVAARVLRAIKKNPQLIADYLDCM